MGKTTPSFPHLYWWHKLMRESNASIVGDASNVNDTSSVGDSFVMLNVPVTLCSVGKRTCAAWCLATTWTQTLSRRSGCTRRWPLWTSSTTLWPCVWRSTTTPTRAAWTWSSSGQHAVSLPGWVWSLLGIAVSLLQTEELVYTERIRGWGEGGREGGGAGQLEGAGNESGQHQVIISTGVLFWGLNILGCHMT